MADRPLLSLCVIARDEAELLSRCLDSATSLVDEIVLVDTGSADATPRIAQHCGARVFRRDWDDDFSAARNAALKRARGRFVLTLDADEWIEGGAAPEALRAHLARSDAEAFSVTVHDHLDSGAGRRYPLVRLFRNRPGHRYAGTVHEQVTLSIEPEACGLVVGHDGYMEPRVSVRGKRERNLRLLRRRLERHPDDATGRYHLIRELIAVRTGRAVPGGHLREALAECERLDPWRGALPTALDADFARLWSMALLAVGRPDDALKLLISRGDGSPAFELIRAEAELATANGDVERAGRAVRRIRGCFDRADAGGLPERETSLTGPVARALAASGLAWIGRFDEARTLAEEAMIDPGGGAAPYNALAEVERAAGRPAEAVRACRQGIDVDPHDPRAWLGLGCAMLANGDAADAVEPLTRALALAPGWDEASALLAQAQRVAGAGAMRASG